MKCLAFISAFALPSLLCSASLEFRSGRKLRSTSRNSTELQDLFLASDDVARLTPANIAFRRSVGDCENSYAARAAMGQMDQGNSTAYHRDRANYVYMRSSWCALRYLGPEAHSIVDVGSSWPPFLRSVNWIHGDRTIVSKYFPGEGGSQLSVCGAGRTECTDQHSDINVVIRDFSAWQPSGAFDLVLCSQVLEHLDAPASFLQKLLRTGKTVLVSVPYAWPDYNMKFHKQHKIYLKDVRKWAGMGETYYYIARESHGGPYSRRLLAVFKGRN